MFFLRNGLSEEAQSGREEGAEVPDEAFDMKTEAGGCCRISHGLMQEETTIRTGSLSFP